MDKDAEKKLDEILAKAKSMKKEQKLDLSSDEDLSIAVMNLVSIEEHFFFTGAKTGNKKYFEMILEVREMRKELLKKLLKNTEGEMWCLPAETNVYTNPEPKAISDISINEKVLTANGKFMPVSHVFERNYKGEMINIKPYYADTLSITPEHPVLCATKVREKQKNLWRKNFTKPQISWKEAKDLEETDFLLFPRFKATKDRKEVKIKYSWTNTGCFRPTKFERIINLKINKELMELVGIYLSEGSINERYYQYKGTKKHNYQLFFSFGKHERFLIKRTSNNFKKIFGFFPRITQTHTSIDINCGKRAIVKFFDQFGRRSSEKQLPFWIVRLPTKKLLPIIWGLIKGDGSVSKYSLKFFTTSKKLAYQLRLILFKIGIIHSLHLREKEKIQGGFIEGRKIIPRSDGFAISISGDAARILYKKIGLKYKVKKTSGNFGYVLKKFVMIPIKKIEKSLFNGKVYNLEVPFEQSYTTFTGVVHNCISKHLLAASMRLMEVGTKQLGVGNKEEAYELFEKAYNIYALFWGLNLNVVQSSDIKEIDANAINKHDQEKRGFMGKLGALVKKVIDCCIE